MVERNVDLSVENGVGSIVPGFDSYRHILALEIG